MAEPLKPLPVPQRISATSYLFTQERLVVDEPQVGQLEYTFNAFESTTRLPTPFGASVPRDMSRLPTDVFATNFYPDPNAGPSYYSHQAQSATSSATDQSSRPSRFDQKSGTADTTPSSTEDQKPFFHSGTDIDTDELRRSDEDLKDGVVPVKSRRRTSPAQLRILEEAFAKNTKPDLNARKGLSERLDMSPREVQVWFQNRRAKVKRLRERAEKSRGTKERGSALSRTVAAWQSTSDGYGGYQYEEPDSPAHVSTSAGVSTSLPAGTSGSHTVGLLRPFDYPSFSGVPRLSPYPAHPAYSPRETVYGYAGPSAAVAAATDRFNNMMTAVKRVPGEMFAGRPGPFAPSQATTTEPPVPAVTAADYPFRYQSAYSTIDNGARLAPHHPIPHAKSSADSLDGMSESTYSDSVPPSGRYMYAASSSASPVVPKVYPHVYATSTTAVTDAGEPVYADPVSTYAPYPSLQATTGQYSQGVSTLAGRQRSPSHQYASGHLTSMPHRDE